MYNVLDFIDSPDIREYNKNMVFTPAEETIIILHSCNKSIYDKIEAWEHLLNCYTEEEFQVDSISCGMWDFDDPNRSFRDTIKANIAAYKATLEGIPSNCTYSCTLDDVTFGTMAVTYADVNFSTYKLAYDYLMHFKQDCLNDKDFASVRTYGEIVRNITLSDTNVTGITSYTFRFNNDMVLYDVTPEYDVLATSSSYGSLEHVYMYLPLPFKAGDIVKSITPRYTDYGVFSRNQAPREYDYSLNTDDDSSGFGCSIDTFSKKYGFDYTDGTTNPFSLQYASIDELKDDDIVLKAISAVKKNKLDSIEMLHHYNYGISEFISWAKYHLSDEIFDDHDISEWYLGLPFSTPNGGK